MKNFGLIGAAGYVAHRHMKAIADTNNRLIAIMDPSDSVGIIDSYFPEAEYFAEIGNLENYINDCKRSSQPIDYIAVCSPNYLHDVHCRSGLRSNTDVICEKPLVLNPWNLDALKKIELETGRSIYNILQLRHHNSIKKLKSDISSDKTNRVYDIDLNYISTRGAWYHSSWKGNLNKSGGIATNIGIHLFDMLIWIFGKPIKNTVHIHNHETAAGFLELEKANVRWLLSVDDKYIPQRLKEQNQRTYRAIRMPNKEIEFSAGFTELHSESYRYILNGNGYGTDEVRPSINLVHEIRNSNPVGIKGSYHPFLMKNGS